MCSNRGSPLWKFIVTLIDNYRWVIDGVPMVGNDVFIRIVVIGGAAIDAIDGVLAQKTLGKEWG
jgi:hypothetical protein